MIPAELLLLPVPFAEVEVTLVGVTTITFEVSAVLVVVDVVVPCGFTGPLTPEVFVVVAFVVDVDPLTTVTGPFAPFVPIVSAALDGRAKKRATDSVTTRSDFKRALPHMNKGSRAGTSCSNAGLGKPNLLLYKSHESLKNAFYGVPWV